MSKRVQHIVIVGGGTAGWITAGVLAARHPDRSENGLKITVIESPDVPIIGVGEGTWPTIRRTLARIGITEAEFLSKCSASFKQGSRFEGWVTGEDGDSYVHPFDLPVSQNGTDVLHAWKTYAPQRPFAEAVCAQVTPALSGLAPRQRGMPDYMGALNYAYHLDAPSLANLIREHAVGKLGVRHIQDHVTEIVGEPDSDIEAVVCTNSGRISGDLFVDCTGQASLLLGEHFNVPFEDQSHILFNNRAVVTQVPVDQSSKITSETVSTAHEAGWIWDIGLTKRRGVGCVYSSEFMSDERAEETLRTYIGDTGELPVRQLKFKSGHRSHFWHQNCVAVGLSAGFLEPLEASAIVLLELSAEMLAENLPANAAAIPLEAKRFNTLFRYRWGRIIDFLKLHYVLSKRSEPYWVENRNPDTIPQRLQDYLETWTHRPPGPHDFDHASEVFPVSSYLYVLYGMGMSTSLHPTLQPKVQDALAKEMQNIARKQRALASSLPTNRALLSGLTLEPVH